MIKKIDKAAAIFVGSIISFSFACHVVWVVDKL